MPKSRRPAASSRHPDTRVDCRLARATENFEEQVVRKYQEYRDQARQLTTGLLVTMAIAVVGTIVVSALAMAGVTVFGAYAYLCATTSIKMPTEHWQHIFLARLQGAAILTSLMVVGAALYKSYQLAEGGGRLVAKSMGGTRVSDHDQDLARRKVHNVVEELAIATGLRAPPVYVLEVEPAINAFAAGYGDKDAVVGVTRGALDRLERHQLQGVLAHEFSHIINGDIRLNIRLLGILTGIQAISFVSQYLIRLGTPSSSSNRTTASGKHPLGMAFALAFGVGIWPIGQIGSLFALLITSAVNRQREFLADASAVQFTRDPHGLCEALAIMSEGGPGSCMKGAAARIASHMFFAASSYWHRMLETHPPIEERIRRLDPNLPTAETLRQQRCTAGSETCAERGTTDL
jgi:Zn-dependent protease with chaperone function